MSSVHGPVIGDKDSFRNAILFFCLPERHTKRKQEKYKALKESKVRYLFYFSVTIQDPYESNKTPEEIVHLHIGGA